MMYYLREKNLFSTKEILKVKSANEEIIIKHNFQILSMFIIETIQFVYFSCDY